MNVVSTISVIIKLLLIFSWIKFIAKVAIISYIKDFQRYGFNYFLAFIALSTIGVFVINLLVNFIFLIIGGI